MINLFETFLPNDKAHAFAADIGRTMKLIPVIDETIEVVVAPIKTIVSTDSKLVFSVLYFLNIFFETCFFVFEVCDHLFTVVDMVNKIVNIVQFAFSSLF